MALIFIDGQYSHIECDAGNCVERSPPAPEMIANGGLRQMGWFVEGGSHRCPKHVADDTAKGGPRYLIWQHVDGQPKLVLYPAKL